MLHYCSFFFYGSKQNHEDDLHYNGNLLPILESKKVIERFPSQEEDLLVVRNGYLRIELDKGIFPWTAVSLPKLAEYHTLSHRVTFLQDHAMWTAFWLEVCANSKDYLSACRQCVVTMYLSSILLCPLSIAYYYQGLKVKKLEDNFVFEDYFYSEDYATKFDDDKRTINALYLALDVLLNFSHVLLYLVLQYSTLRACRLSSEKREMFQRYALQNFALSTSNEGCIMEYRTAFDSRPAALGGVSVQTAHYLYLFPLASSQLLVTDVNASVSEKREVV